MSNHPQQQHNQPKQAQPAQPAKFEPDRKTIFLVQTDAVFEGRARTHVIDRYGEGHRDPNTDELKHRWRIETTIDASRLTPETTIVVLHVGGKRVFDEATGKWRARDKGSKVRGERVRDPEPPAVLESKPVRCRDHYRQVPDGDDYVDHLSVIRAINKQIAPNRAQLDVRTPAAKSRDPQLSISVRAT